MGVIGFVIWPLSTGLRPQASQPINSHILSLAASMPYQVQELQPSSAVSLIDTDMEAQVVPSLETEQVQKRLVMMALLATQPPQ